MKILRYNQAWACRWNELVAKSSNGTFLHNRSYMDYHSDRFADFSLLALDDKERLVAVLPANAVGDKIYSHQGLTYGGWVVDPRHVDANVMLEIWQVSVAFLKENGFAGLIYKAIPSIYHRYPAEDDTYAIFRVGGELSSVLISSSVDLSCPLSFNSNATRGMKNARSLGVVLRDDVELEEYWGVLSDLLREKYGVEPVHSLEEMKLLQSRFPENMRLHCAYHEGEIVAGTLVYLCGQVAHAQYIAASARGKELKALPLLFDHVMMLYRERCRYFDFGTSNEQGGAYLNAGLLRQKAGMGARGIAHPTYAIPL